MASIELWDLWFPGAGATGQSFARGRLDATEIILVHAAPDRLDVAVRDDDGRVIASASGLERTIDSPMARLTRRDGSITRADIWPEAADLGRPVILAGGEVGILESWWHADDKSEWRWRIELFNRR